MRYLESYGGYLNPEYSYSEITSAEYKSYQKVSLEKKEIDEITKLIKERVPSYIVSIKEDGRIHKIWVRDKNENLTFIFSKNDDNYFFIMDYRYKVRVFR